MIAESKLLGFVLLLLGGQRGPVSPYAPPSPAPFPPGPSPLPTPDTPVAPPWPVAPPTSLPPFPGPDWEYDEPPSAAVVQRAYALLDSLWARGAGAGTVEMTAGHYVGYKSEIMANGKRGVTAWRIRAGAPPYVPPAPAVPPDAPLPPGVVPQVHPNAPPAPATPANPYVPAVDVIPTNPSANAMTLRDVQQGLATLGYTVAVDGIMGPQTQAAIKAFQKANPPLSVDGIAGPLTKSTLLARLAAYHGSAVVPAPPKPSAPGQVNTVKDVQSALNLLGVANPPLVVDGIWGAKSAAATRTFQASHPPLVVDGVAGVQTKAALAAAMGGRNA